MKLSEVSGDAPKRVKLSDIEADTEKPSAAKAFGKSAFESAGGAAGGYAGAELGATLGAMTGPAAPVAVPLGAIAGGIAGYYGGEKLQEKAGQLIPSNIKETLGFSPEQRTAEKRAQPTASNVGKYAPDVAAIAPSIYSMGRYGIAKGTDLASKLFSGKAAKEAELAQKGLQTSIPTTAEEAGKGVTQRAAKETEAEYAKRARQQESFGQAKKKFTTAAQAERENAARKFSDLGKPSDTAKLGDEMQRRLTGTEFTRGARRSQRAAEDSKKYFSQARERGNFVESDQGISFLNYLKSQMFSQKVTPAERKLAEQMYVDLAAAKDIEAVEKTFRRFNEVSKGAPKEGYDAVMQQYAGRVSDNLSEALNKFAPKRKEFRDTYKELSGPLDAYETAFGAKGVAMEKAVPGRVKMMPTDYPSTYFKNRDTVNALREMLAGDEAAVRKFANQHAVNELQGKTAVQAEQWLKTNGEWLNTVEGLNTRVNRYVAELKRSELAAAQKESQAAQVAEKGKKVGQAGEARQADIAKTAGEQKQRLDQFKEQISLYPEKATTIGNNLVKYLSDNKMLPSEKLNALKAEIDAVEKTADVAQKAKQVRNLFVKYGIYTAGGGYGAYEISKKLF